MTGPPEDPAPGIERVVDAISEGARVEWEAEMAARPEDAETLEALRLIDEVARAQRAASGVAAASPGAPVPERSWGNLVLRGRIGAGSYGEVFRAFDPGLQREVALKLWSAAARPGVTEELLVEARALARVRHPNVLLVHGADVHDGRVGMWTELLEGATIEHLLATFGPCTWREAALYGIDLCRALVAMHAIGLVHGDVKAANVMRERGGRVVLMDFGSASIVAGDAARDVQGTPLATAPEVLRGEPATVASDLYSLGVLLFRQVAGRYPVEAGSLEELRAKLAGRPAPSLREVRPDVPLEFARVIDRALERDPAKRPASAAAMERLLAEALSADWGQALPPAPPAAEGPRPVGFGRPALAWGVALAALAVVAVSVAAIAWFGRGPGPGAARPMQFTVKLPLGEHLRKYANVAISPDGRVIAFASLDTLGRQALWVRRFDALESVRIPGTEGATYPFWSPDSRDIGFFTETHLKRVGLGGDSVRIVCEAELGRGGTWNRRGTIVFAASTQGPLLRVAAEGGTPIPVTALAPGGTEASHRWPWFLPDGERFLYVRTPAKQGTYGLYVGSLRSERRVYVGEVESGAAYTSGLLVYLLNRTMEARPFDARTLRWSGDPVPLSDIPGTGGSLAEPHASVSANGTLVYTLVPARESRLEWVDVRTGVATSLAVGPYFDPALSPDGRRVAVERVEGTGHSNIWMVDALTGAAERWSAGDGLQRKPVWSPDGDSLVYTTNRSGSYEFFVRATNGSLAERRLFAPPRALLMWVNDWRRGGLLTFDRYEPGTGYNVYEMRRGTPVPVASSAASEMRGALSPDARWLAYDSDASGRFQIHVVDRRTSERYVLPGEGGIEPCWARESGRLFYATPAGEFFEATPLPGRPPTEWPSRRLFRTGIVSGFDVDARGERVLCCVRVESTRPAEIGVLANLKAAVAEGL